MRNVCVNTIGITGKGSEADNTELEFSYSSLVI